MFSKHLWIFAFVVAFAETAALTQVNASRPLTAIGHVPDSAGIHFFPRAIDEGTWTPLANSFGGSEPDTALLMMDGTVMMHDGCTPDWYKLTPDANGQYFTGVWTKASSMPSGFAPLYFGSVKGPLDEILVFGGEYNGKSLLGKCKEKMTGQAALYFDGSWSTWTMPWSNIGDAQTATFSTFKPKDVVCGGCFYVAQPQSKQSEYCCNGLIGEFGKADENDEEAYTLLPDGTILTVDTHKGVGKGQIFSVTEIFTPPHGSIGPMWKRAANTANPLVDPVYSEIGPALLLPSGHVFQAGANSCGDATQCPAYINLYEPENKSWVSAGQIPQISGQYYDVADGPAALLPNGKVLIQAGPGYGLSPSHFFEFDETDGSIALVDGPKSANKIASFESRMLVLPTGQILWTSDRGDVELYTPNGAPKSEWKPAITKFPRWIKHGDGYGLRGTLFFGLSQGAAYGDDAQMASNYPLVRVTNQSSRHVCYATVNDYDLDKKIYVAAVAYRGTTGITFITPNNCELGPSDLQVVTNGIASDPVTVHIKP